MKKFKTFFILTNEKKLNDQLECSLSGEETENFQKIYSCERGKFTLSVYSFDIIQKENEDIINNKNQKFEAKIKLCQKNYISSTKFKEKIFFSKTKNNFIYYDIIFRDYKGYLGTYSSPEQLHLSEIEKFQIYIRALETIKSKPSDILSISLYLDSKKYYDFSLKYFLMLLKLCYDSIEGKELLFSLKSQRFRKKSEDKIENEQINILYLIEEEKKIIKYCNSEK